MSLLDVAGMNRAKRQTDGSYLIPCPVPGHGQGKGDKNPSCHVWHDDAKDRMAAKCFAGCVFEDVKAALEDAGVWDKPKRQASETKEYAIRDAEGKQVCTHIRIEKADGSKTFKWAPRGVKPDQFLYGLEKLAKHPKAGVVLCEGEKAADAAQLAAVKAVVLGTVTGASSCPGVVLEHLKGRIVVLWPDNDEMGLRHMGRIAVMLKDVAKEVRMVDVSDIKPKGDAADIYKAEALKLMRSAKPYDPDAAPRPAALKSFADVQDEVLKTLDEYAIGNRSDVVPCGLRRVDAVLNGGWQKGAMTIIAAPSGGGKTSLVLQFADHAKKALIVAPEMTVASLARRMLLRRADASMQDFRADEKTQARVISRVAELTEGNVVFLDLLEPMADEIREAVVWHKPALVVLDYAQFLTPMDDPKRYLALAKFAQFSIELAMEQKVAVVMTSQVNVTKDGDYVLRESQMLNHKCHAQLDFYVDRPKNERTPPRIQDCYFWVAKQRDGISLVKIEGLRYERAKYRVFEAQDEPEADEPYWMK